MANFWTDATSEDPKRNFRFLVGITSMEGNAEWFAKKVSRPNFNIEQTEHMFLNHTFYYPTLALSGIRSLLHLSIRLAPMRSISCSRLLSSVAMTHPFLILLSVEQLSQKQLLLGSLTQLLSK